MTNRVIQCKYHENGHTMDTPPLDDLPPAMPGHVKQYVQGARASLNPRFSPVRTPLQSGTSHEHVQHSRQGQCALCDKLASTDTALEDRTPRTHATLQGHQTWLQRGMQCCELRNDTRHDPHTRGGALRPLDPGSSSLACEPARRPRWAGRPVSSVRQSGAAARTSRTQ